MSRTVASKSKSERRREESPLDRVLRALNHPLRRRILRVLVDGSGSASSIAKKLDLSLATVSYHLNQVLAKECNVVELVEAVPRRGAIEKIYKLKFQALSQDEVAKGGSGGKRKMSLEECIIVAVAAMDADVFDDRRESGWEWFLANVDEDGWAEIQDARRDFNKRVQAATDGGRGRRGAPLRDVVAGAAAFPSLAT